MPTINVIPSWTIKKLTEDQEVAGTLVANGVYSFKFVRDGYEKEIVASVKEVNGKSYIGWAVTDSLPEVAATVTTPDTPVEAETPADAVVTETVEDTPVDTTEPEVTKDEAPVVTEDVES